MVTVLLTGVGCPGIVGTIHSLKHYRLIGVDIDPGAVGRHLVEAFHVVPEPELYSAYERALREICELYSVDVIIPQTTREVEVLPLIQSNLPAKVAVSSPTSIAIANDKYQLMKFAHSYHLPVADFFPVVSADDFKRAASYLGYPEKKFVVKISRSSGGRGVRIISEQGLTRSTYENSKTSMEISYNEVYNMIEREGVPDGMIAMEYLEGDEYSVDCFRGDVWNVAIPRKRDRIRSGISFATTPVVDHSIIEASRIFAKRLDLQYCFGFQFMLHRGEPKIIECNPRVQGTMVASTLNGFNLIDAAVKFAIGEPVAFQRSVKFKQVERYWGIAQSEDWDAI